MFFGCPLVLIVLQSAMNPALVSKMPEASSVKSLTALMKDKPSEDNAGYETKDDNFPGIKLD